MSDEKKFTTDGCSVPDPLRPILPEEPPAERAACDEHDIHYQAHDLTRAEADAKLYEGLVAAGMSRPKAWAYWVAVRIFGGSHWSPKR